MLDLLDLLHHPLISLLLLPILPFMVCLGAAAGQRFAGAPMFPEAAACPCLFLPASLGHGRTDCTRTEASDRVQKTGLGLRLTGASFHFQVEVETGTSFSQRGYFSRGSAPFSSYSSLLAVESQKLCSSLGGARREGKGKPEYFSIALQL